MITSIFNDSLHRRKFLGYMGAGILSVTLAKAGISRSGMPLEDKQLDKDDKIPVPRKNLNAPSELPESDYFTPVHPDKKIGFALVGLGNLTLGELMPAFGNCKYAKPVALVSGHMDKARKVAKQYGIDEKNIYSYKNFDDIKNNPDIDAVYIVLPNSMHHEFTIRAAKAGKHVLCEKPMANTARECEEMIDACKKANRKLMVAYRIQYEPNNTKCREWIQTAEFGHPKLMELYNGQHLGDPAQWRLNKALGGGGPLMDVGIYCINTSRFLLGKEPEAVFASAHYNPADPRFKEVEESMLFQLHFPDGIMVNCMTTFGAHICRRYRVYTDKGAWFGMDPAFAYKGLQLELSQVRDKLEYKAYPAIPEKNQFALEIDHFATCIYEDKDPYTKGEEGLQDMRIIEALYQSAREGRVIKLETITTKDPFRGSKPNND